MAASATEMRNNAMKPAITLALLSASLAVAVHAAPGDILARYRAEAAQASPGFAPAAARGQALFQRNWGVSDSLPRCTTCHGDDLRRPGQHAITGKAIKPLLPTVEASRLSDPAKTEKWFRRNCREVVGRECTPGEKADVVAFLMQGA